MFLIRRVSTIVYLTKGLTIDELVVDEGVSLLVENQKVKRIIE